MKFFLKVVANNGPKIDKVDLKYTLPRRQVSILMVL